MVSLLEPDSDLYNTGIVDVSYRYEKMYVVRPQFFIPITTLLRDAAKNSLQYKNELEEVKEQNIDISLLRKSRTLSRMLLAAITKSPRKSSRMQWRRSTNPSVT